MNVIKQMSFTVAGGDMRNIKLIDLLLADGHAVHAFGFERSELPAHVSKHEDIKSACEGSDCVILPVPAQGDGGRLNAPFSNTEITVDEILDVQKRGQIVVGGKLGQEKFEKAGRLGVQLIDYLEREEMAVANAIPTAEGAVNIAMEELPITLHRSRCLVIGYGRIGKLLAHLLQGFGALVTVSARKYADLAWIKAYGYEPVNTFGLDGVLPGFDVVFNTVPALVLDRECIRLLKKGCVVIDLASKPGGIDFQAAKELGVLAIWALSLPGKVAPHTSGAIIRDTVYNILDERGI